MSILGSGAHINTARVAQDPRAAAAEIKRDLDLFNLQLSDVYLMLPRIASHEDDKRRKEIDLYKSLLPFIIALETPGGHALARRRAGGRCGRVRPFRHRPARNAGSIAARYPGHPPAREY
ncbi:hypothetical protein HC928_21380 [bacterium]|nr:hypothetical protein [bacterium]